MYVHFWEVSMAFTRPSKVLLIPPNHRELWLQERVLTTDILRSLLYRINSINIVGWVLLLEYAWTADAVIRDKCWGEKINQKKKRKNDKPRLTTVCGTMVQVVGDLFYGNLFLRNLWPKENDKRYTERWKNIRKGKKVVNVLWSAY